MVEIRTVQTERLVALHPETPPLGQLCSAFLAHRVTEDPENDDVIRLLSRAGGRLSPENGFCFGPDVMTWRLPPGTHLP